jgi:citronellol/citronellal dehydrogenase
MNANNNFNTTVNKNFNKVAIITGASRGIGRSIAISLAQAGYCVSLWAKSSEEQPNPFLSGTIHSVATEIEHLVGKEKTLPISVDIRDEQAIAQATQQVIERFGRVDLLVNNASALSISDTLNTSAKKYDLINGINSRGTFLCSQAVLPHLLKNEIDAEHGYQGQVITMSPPLSINPKWFKGHGAYTLSKFGMTLITQAIALEHPTIHSATLWPQTLINTDALKLIPNLNIEKDTRNPQIIADSVLALTQKTFNYPNGQSWIDEQILQAVGIFDFSKYLSHIDGIPKKDLFVE